MFIVISGGSTTAEYLISMMLEQNHRITIIEEDRETIDHLADTLPPEVLIIEGDGTDSAVQLDARRRRRRPLRRAHGHDETNLVACRDCHDRIQRATLHCQRQQPQERPLIPRGGHDPSRRPSSSRCMVEEEAIVGDMRMVFSLREGDIVMVETKLPAKMRHHNGVRVADIPFSHDTQLIAVIRDDRVRDDHGRYGALSRRDHHRRDQE